MHYPEDKGSADRWASAALAMIESLELHRDPLNFMIWYEYYKGQNLDLCVAVDKLLAEEAKFSRETSENLYEEYFGTDKLAREIREAGGQIQAAVDSVVDYLERANRESSRHIRTLADQSGDLAAAIDDGDVARHVSGILQQAHQVIEWSKSLAGRLGESAHEMIDLRQHLEEVSKEALTDGLTGLANRKHFDQRIREAAGQAEADGSGLCLLFTDIDHFKKFNDTHGHRIGDQVLKLVGGLLKEGVADGDLPARYGGEEFAILLRDTELDKALDVADRIRGDIARKDISSAKTGMSYGSVTMSIGVAQYRAGEPPEDLMQRADQALYRAKAAGRNRVVGETDDDATSLDAVGQ